MKELLFPHFKKICIFGCAGSLLLLRWFFSSWGERGLLSVAVRRLLVVVASRVAEHGLQSCSSWALEHRLEHVARGLSCFEACGVFPD